MSITENTEQPRGFYGNPLAAYKKAAEPQFNRSEHGSLYDRGSADSYYRRPPSPHWYPEGAYKGCRVVDLNEAEIEEYCAGYGDNEKSGCFKEW